MTKEIIHGRPSSYNNDGCRCTQCTKAWADYIREGGYVKRYQARIRKQKEEKKLST